MIGSTRIAATRESGERELLASRFLESGDLSGEFRNMSISDDEVRTYIAFQKSHLMAKVHSLFETLAGRLGSASFDPFKKVAMKWTDRYGRMGLEFKHHHAPTLGTWFFFGIYYDPQDHGIPFKADEPELAFFFDILSEHRRTLQQSQSPELLASLAALEKEGFEQNLTTRLTRNNWRLLCYRTPLSQALPLTPEALEARLLKIVAQLGRQKGFVDTFVRSAG